MSTPVDVTPPVTGPPRRTDSRSARFAWAAGLGLGFQIVNLAVGLWLTRFLLARFGEGPLGWWAVVVVTLGYVGMVDLGLSALLPREVAAAAGAGADVRAVTARFFRLALLQLPLAALIGVGGAVVLARADDGHPEVAAAVMVVAVLAYPFRVGPLVLSGLQDVRFVGFAQLGAYAAGVGTTVTAVLAGWGVGGLAAGWGVQVVVALTAGWGRLVAAHLWAAPTPWAVAAARVPGRLVGSGLWLGASGLGVLLANTADLVVLSRLYPADVVFRYACTTKLLVVVTPLVYTLCQVAVPGLAEVRAAGDPARARRAALAYAQLVLLVSGACGAAVLAGNRGFVAWWVGPDKYLGDGLTVLAVIGLNLRHALNALAVTLFCLGRERTVAAVTLADGLLTAGLTAGLVAWGGPALGPLGSLAAAAGFTMPVMLVVLARAGVPLGDYLWVAGRWVVPYAVAAGAGYAFGRAIELGTAVGVGAVVTGTTGLYILFVGPSALAPPLGGYLRPQLGWLVGRSGTAA